MTTSTDERAAAGPVTVPVDAPPAAGRIALASLLLVTGVLHFVSPRFFEQIVPRWAGSARFHVMWSGVAELLAGSLLLVPGTRRVGAWLALVLLVLVYPANVQMAIDAGRPRDVESTLIWARLPLQVPMWRAAWRQTR